MTRNNLPHYNQRREKEKEKKVLDRQRQRNRKTDRQRVRELDKKERGRETVEHIPTLIRVSKKNIPSTLILLKKKYFPR